MLGNLLNIQRYNWYKRVYFLRYNLVLILLLPIPKTECIEKISVSDGHFDMYFFSKFWSWKRIAEQNYFVLLFSSNFRFWWVFIPPRKLCLWWCILFSRCPCVRLCVRPSVTFCFLNILKSHCWIFIKPCKHVQICKTNTLNKKVRARGQFYKSYFPL